MPDRSTRLSSSVVAAAVAGVLLFVFGTTYRVLAARLAAPVTATPIEPAVLERFPLRVGAWTGEDVPMDDAIIRRTNTDARINRRYSRGKGAESVSFYVASGVKARDLMPHRPEVCYTGAGWTLLDRRFLELPLSDGSKLPCNLMQFSRGALSTQRIMVLDYYIVDGQYCHDVSLLRSKAWRGSGTVRYVAQVQIAASLGDALTGEAAGQVACTFAEDSALLIARLFPGLGQAQGPDGSRDSSGGK